jgi:hypothetical protein
MKCRLFFAGGNDHPVFLQDDVETQVEMQACFIVMLSSTSLMIS